MNGPGLEKAKVGEESVFEVDTSDAGIAPLKVDVLNEDGTHVPRVRVKDLGDGLHR